LKGCSAHPDSHFANWLLRILSLLEQFGSFPGVMSSEAGFSSAAIPFSHKQLSAPFSALLPSLLFSLASDFVPSSSFDFSEQAAFFPFSS